MLSEILEEHGIDTKIVGLCGHVITLVEVEPGIYWIFGPIHGIVICHTLAEVESNPSLILPYYAEKGITGLGDHISLSDFDGYVRD